MIQESCRYISALAFMACAALRCVGAPTATKEEAPAVEAVRRFIQADYDMQLDMRTEDISATRLSYAVQQRSVRSKEMTAALTKAGFPDADRLFPQENPKAHEVWQSLDAFLSKAHGLRLLAGSEPDWYGKHEIGTIRSYFFGTIDRDEMKTAQLVDKKMEYRAARSSRVIIGTYSSHYSGLAVNRLLPNIIIIDERALLAETKKIVLPEGWDFDAMEHQIDVCYRCGLEETARKMRWPQFFYRALGGKSLEERLRVCEEALTINSLTELNSYSDPLTTEGLIGVGRYSAPALIELKALLCQAVCTSEPHFAWSELMKSLVKPEKESPIASSLRFYVKRSMPEIIQLINKNPNLLSKMEITHAKRFTPSIARRFNTRLWRLDKDGLRRISKEWYLDTVAATYLEGAVVAAEQEGDVPDLESKLRKRTVKALALRPGSNHILYLACRAYRHLGDWTKCEEVGLKLLGNTAPESKYRREAFATLGRSAVGRGNMPKAVQYFEELIKMDPNYPTPGYAVLGDHYAKEGRRNDAIDMYEKFLRFLPNHSMYKRVQSHMMDLERKNMLKIPPTKGE